MDKASIEVVRLLLESAPTIFMSPHFAMKGGTAINLFIEDMPRLSVDTDVEEDCLIARIRRQSRSLFL